MVDNQERYNPIYFTERSVCPVCAGRNGIEFYRSPLDEEPIRGFIASHYETQGTVDWNKLAGTDYVLRECQTCFLIYQVNVPLDAMLYDIYCVMVAPGPLAQLEKQRLTLENFNQIASELETLFQLTGKHPSDVTFLDYGFGHGRWARVARGMGATVFGIEHGEDKEREAAQLGIAIVSDAEIDAMRFDIVHTEQVFEHLVNPGRDFKRLAGITDHVFKVAVPRPGDIRQLVQRHGMTNQSPLAKYVGGARLTMDDESYNAIFPLEHLNAYSDRTIEYLASQTDMELISRARRCAPRVDLSTARSAVRSGKRILSPLYRKAASDQGYYVLKPRASA